MVNNNGNELLNIGINFWNFWRNIKSFIPVNRWEKILKDGDNTTFSCYTFLYFMDFAEKYNLDYFREKKRNDFTMNTSIDSKPLIHIEHENQTKLEKIENSMERLKNSEYPIKIIIAYSLEKDLETTIEFVEQYIEKNKKDSEIWMLIIGYGQGKTFFPEFSEDDSNAIIWNDGKKVLR